MVWQIKMGKIKTDYRHTVFACYIGYITQAIVNNFAPLLFLTFHDTYHIPLSKISVLIILNFGTQLLVDLAAAKFADKAGYRLLTVLAHIMCAAGLIFLGILPGISSNPFAGIAAAVMLYAVGGGLIEVLVSPIVEGVPSKEKAGAMSLLHSFYCWGSVLVVSLSTLMFHVFGVDSWRGIAIFWAVIPALNAVFFLTVPITPPVESGEGMSIRQLFCLPLFWVLALLMFCAGASELAMSQWASAFAESGLSVSKSVGDLAGPCFFAALMGSSRIVHAKVSGRVHLYKYLGGCAALCIVSYLLAALSPGRVLPLFGCGLCGVSVGVMWPGTFSLASEKCKKGGTAMFALLALAGDLGCASGPWLVGNISEAQGDNLKAGLLSAAAFPLLMLAGLWLAGRNHKK